MALLTKCAGNKVRILTRNTSEVQAFADISHPLYASLS
jgi:hypothetical protein